jgi:Fusaric acid resistance protein-like
VRTALGVLTPLAIGMATGRTAYGTYAALGALPAGYVVFSGVTRTRVLAVAAAAVGMAISAFAGAATTGVLDWVMVLYVLIWGYLTGLAATLGPTATSVAQQWSVGLLLTSALPVGAGEAAIRAALVLGGGLWQGALVASSWALNRGSAERTALAASYAVLSQHATQLAEGGNGLLWPEEMPGTSALADPNPLLRSAERLDLVNLAEEAERIRVSLTAIGAVASEESAALRSLLLASAQALGDIAGALSARRGRRRRRQLRSLGQSVERMAAIAPAPDAGWRWAGEALLGQLRSAIRGAQRLLGAAQLGSGQPRPGRPQAGAVVRPGTIRLQEGLLTLRASAGPSTAAGRHALRLAVAATLTALLAQVTRLPHDYWAVLTVIFVLRPDYSSTLQRGVQRAGGTIVGAGLGIATALLARAGNLALLAGTGVSLAAAYAVYMANYLLLGVFLADFVVVFLALLGLPAEQTALARLAATAVGAAVALIAYVAWPSWEGSSANETFAILLKDQGQYAAALLRAYSRPADDEEAHLRSLELEGRRAQTDADASADRLSDEPPRPPVTAELARALIAEAQRLALAELTLHAAITPARAFVPADRKGSAQDAGAETGTGPAQAELDRLAAGLETASGLLARSLRALEPPGRLPPLRELRAAITEPLDDDRVLLTTTDSMVDTVNTTADILRRHLGRGGERAAAAAG